MCFFGGERSFDIVDIQAQSFLIVMGRHISSTHEEIGNTRKRESVRKHRKYKEKGVRKPYENG